MKKIIAIIVALAMVMALAVPAFAAEEYTAKLGFAAAGWYPQDWDTSVVVNGDGQYTIESTAVAGTSGLVVFVVDIEGIYADHPEVTAVLDSIEVDGSAVEFNADAVVYGDVEEKGNYRIEIWNEYGSTNDNSVLNGTTFTVGSTLKVTFTVSGFGGAAAPADNADDTVGDGTEADNNTVEPDTTTSSNEDTTPAPSTTTAPNTGLAIAVVPAVMALAAVAVSKKH